MDRKVKFGVTAALLAGALAGCTSTRTMMVKDDEAILSVQSRTTLVSADAVAYQTLKEAAKVTLEHGYRYFTISGAQDTSRRLSMYIPGSAQSSGAVYGYGNSAFYNSSTTYQAPHTSEFQWAGDRVEIKMFPDGDPQADQPRVFDARRILQGNAIPTIASATPSAANQPDSRQAYRAAPVASLGGMQQPPTPGQLAQPADQTALTASSAPTPAPAPSANAPGYWLPGMPIPPQP
jgi:hypothetical protein